MRLSVQECWNRLTAARVARLATAGRDQRPHIVPVTFALDGERVVIGIDQKPKTTTKLRRLRNITENPNVAVLCDHYEEDWSQLWWVRTDGRATVLVEGAARVSAIDALAAKYEPYEDDPPHGPIISIQVESLTGWAYSE
jgi:PPOX class probable F420-dependent enzyme